MIPIIYRVITATGDTYVVTVTPDAQGGYLRLTADGKRGELFSAKNNVTACVAWYAGSVGCWPVAEIVPPGGETRAELVARVRRETLAEARAAIKNHPLPGASS